MGPSKIQAQNPGLSCYVFCRKVDPEQAMNPQACLTFMDWGMSFLFKLSNHHWQSKMQMMFMLLVVDN